MRLATTLAALLVTSLAVAALTASIATADDRSKPWTAGVSEQAKASARALLERGNKLFLEREYLEALSIYQQAIAQWDHPAIRFNVVRCLIQLDRVAEANENLRIALRYGSEPLEDAVYQEAIAYQKLLANRIGTVIVSCTQPGVSVSLDGQDLLTCPGTQQRELTPGRHQLVGVKTGFVTRSETVFVVGGSTERVGVELAPVASTARVVHRWALWKPWAVVASGAALAGLGGLVLSQSHRDMDAYDRALANACFDTGCGPDRPVPADVVELRDRAVTGSRVGVGVIATGAATLMVGGVLAYLNRARTVYEVTPQPGGATLGMRGSF